MWKAFQRYRALDPESRKLFRRAVVLMSRATFSLRTRGFSKTKEALDTGLPSSQRIHPEGFAEALEKTCRMVRAAARYSLVRPTCLAESLTLWFLLREQNIPASLRIGVRKSLGNFEAHAWVECDGAALNQPGEQHRHYATFDAAFSEIPEEQP